MGLRKYATLGLFSFFVLSTLCHDGHANAQCARGGVVSPDLVIVNQKTSLKWSGKCTAVSPKVVGTITVKNIGKTEVKTADAIISFWDSQNEKCREDIANSKPIKPGETVTVDVKSCRFIAGENYRGTRLLHVQVDKKNKVSECNERNNALARPIRIEVQCSKG